MTPKNLVGGRITHVFELEDQTILIIEVRGRVLQVEVWRDPEGNGAGHLDVGLLEGARPGQPVRLAGAAD